MVINTPEIRIPQIKSAYPRRNSSAFRRFGVAFELTIQQLVLRMTISGIGVGSMKTLLRRESIIVNAENYGISMTIS